MMPDTQHRALPGVRYAVMIGDRFVNDFGWRLEWSGFSAAFHEYYSFRTRREARRIADLINELNADQPRKKRARVVAVALTVYWTELKEKGR